MSNKQFKKTFEADGEFGAYHAALKWLEDNGFSSGSMQREAPMGILKGDFVIAKWRNLSNKQRESLDGNLMFVRGRSAEVVIYDRSLVEGVN